MVMHPDYPVGMLDRDLRTAKIPLLRQKRSDIFVPNKSTNSISFKASSANNSNSIITSIVRRKTTKFSFLVWKKGYLLPKFQRLKNVLLVIVYLMLTILPTTHSAPSTMNPPRKVCTWLRTCLVEVNVAKAYAENDKINFTEYPNYVNDTTPISWLPDLGKKVDDNIPQDVLNDLSVEEVLPIIYTNLQKISAVVEDVIQEINDKRLQTYFVLIQERNLHIFEALKQVMGSMGMHIPTDTTDSSEAALPLDVIQAFRENEITRTTAFATIIFRECINNYQYASQTLSHLKNQLDPKQDGCS